MKRRVTTVRDADGATTSLKMSIDDGYVTGRRICPRQAVTGQYSGHADFRNPNFLPKEWGGPRDPLEQIRLGITANGVQQVLATTPDNLYKRATQIKMSVSGGAISFPDAPYVHEFLPEKIEPAVRAADDYGTIVMAHVHSADPINRAIKAGVKSFDHNNLADEKSIQMMADSGASMSVHVLEVDNIVKQYADGDGDDRKIKAKTAAAGIDNFVDWSTQYGVQMAWGIDLLDSADNRAQKLNDLTMWTKWVTSAEPMVQAPSIAANRWRCLASAPPMETLA